MKKVVVGLSGGVDSSVAAYLLKAQGYEVVGLHMLGENKETSAEDEQRVKNLCKTLNIECVVVDYKDHMQIVKDYFVKEYLSGRTPNPCVICNKEVKFKPFLEYAEKLNADYFATGHYARVEHNANTHILKKAVDSSKDQSYFLCKLSKEQLSKVLFPLGELTKAEVKRIAQENNLVDENTKESYDICFLGSQKFKDFMNTNYPEKSGEIKDIKTNKVLGFHNGISKYTIGQRRGINLGGQNGYEDNRWFVVKKDIQTNTLYVSCGEGDELFSSSCLVADFNWMVEKPTQEINAFVKLRYRQPDQLTKVVVEENGNVLLKFYEPQRAVTLGQFAVLYAEDGRCLGGSVITEIYN